MHHINVCSNDLQRGTPNTLQTCLPSCRFSFLFQYGFLSPTNVLAESIQDCQVQDLSPILQDMLWQTPLLLHFQISRSIKIDYGTISTIPVNGVKERDGESMSLISAFICNKCLPLIPRLLFVLQLAFLSYGLDSEYTKILTTLLLLLITTQFWLSIMFGRAAASIIQVSSATLPTIKNPL